MKYFLLVLMFPIGLYAATMPAHAADAARPNVIVFFVDDLGWTDLGCFGSDFYESPHIDRLAADGVKFTQAYAACTVCSPSRAALLTGQYPARLHVTDFIPGHPIENTPLRIPDWTQKLKLEEVTIAELLRDAGYRTAHVGKWHLTPRDRTGDINDDGSYPDYYPDRQGFEFNIGGCERGAPASYYWPYGRGKTLQQRQANNTFRTIPKDGGKEGTYLTDQLTAHALRLIQQFDQQPFFLYFPFYNVHMPLQGRADLVEKFKAKQSQHPDVRHGNFNYAAMIANVDEAIGRVLAQLERHGVADRTLVIFSSDNGGLCPQATTNSPLRQGKGTIYEGGVRVPAIIRWPGHCQAGGVNSEPIITIDFFPTILEATGVTAPPEVAAKIDGRSLLPLLESPATASLDRKALYWHYPHYHMEGAVPHSAVRMGDWKLIERHDGAPPELYDLGKDIHEDHNLAEKYSGQAKRLQNELHCWRKLIDAQMPTPNADYDAQKPIGWARGTRFREIAPVRK